MQAKNVPLVTGSSSSIGFDDDEAYNGNQKKYL
jgi:hypothetical protein